MHDTRARHRERWTGGIGWAAAVAAVVLGTGLIISPAARADETGDAANLTDWVGAPLTMELAAAQADALPASDAGAGEAMSATPDAAAAPAAETPKKSPPLPLYTIEGVGGGLISPMAYLVNASPGGTGLTGGYTFVKIGKKAVQQANLTQTFGGRVEFSYGFVTLDLADFPGDVEDHTGVNIGFKYVVMHNFNLRGLLVPEGTGSPWMPAITGGVTFKYTPAAQEMDRRLGGSLRGIGLERNNGTDFTLTATKTIPNALAARPVMLTGGLRFSQGAELGLLGFGDAYRLTAEGSVCVPVTDRVAVMYEFRQKKNPYRRLGSLVGEEDCWHTLCFGFVLNEHCALACGWGDFGYVVNHREEGVWGFEFKYEF